MSYIYPPNNLDLADYGLQDDRTPTHKAQEKKPARSDSPSSKASHSNMSNRARDMFPPSSPSTAEETTTPATGASGTLPKVTEVFSPLSAVATSGWNDDEPHFLEPGQVVGGIVLEDSELEGGIHEVSGIAENDVNESSGLERHMHGNSNSVASHEEAHGATAFCNNTWSETPGTLASSPATATHRPQDLGGILSHHRDVTTEEVDHLQQRRREVEAQLDIEREEHEHELQLGPEPGPEPERDETSTVGASLADLQAHAGAVPLGEGVAVVNIDQLADLLTPDRCPAPENTPASEPGTVINRGSTLQSGPPNTPTPVAKHSPSSQSPPNPLIKAPLVARPNEGRKVSFADAPTTVPETPFTRTLNYFKELKVATSKNKENSPLKHRRNASLPEEIAALQNEAADFFSDGDGEDLDQYREKDLAPLNPVMETQNAGDIIMSSLASPKAVNLEGAGGQVTMQDELSPRRIKVQIVEEQADGTEQIRTMEFHEEEGVEVVCVVEREEVFEWVDEEVDHPGIINAIAMMPKVVFWMVCGAVERGVEEVLNQIF
ncbi:hypothetical protein P154DRAFT_607738 [Amniculicola lignicola CBS 123094]|uniref:Uncharacterized protein n=1 Tax=Amniculicola lignicola CBS 123094 TaxID=1392246 RepID=A0A6A5W956_9PLEO|nr:hypothetical protein P154DRAFT_607738 [Amniculicola lignicola CBS 123094]